jgi:hypothetical protein
VLLVVRERLLLITFFPRFAVEVMIHPISKRFVGVATRGRPSSRTVGSGTPYGG